MKTLPEGFKDSDIGPIPEDWEVKMLSHVCSMQSGQTITAKKIGFTGNYPCYGGNGFRGYTQTYTHDGVFPIIGRQGALCGNTKLAIGKFYASEHAVVVTCNQKANPIWLYYTLGSMNLNQYAEATAQPGLAVSKIMRQYIPLPLLPEQQAIAGALSDIDALIGAQEELLAKKRAIKQGAMQELLTGRRRLPGFPVRPMKQTDIGPIPEDWEVKELGGIGTCLTTASYTRAQLKTAGDVKYIHYGDIHVKYKYLLDVGKKELPYIESYMVKQFALLRNGDLIIADASEDYEGLGDCIEIYGAEETLCISGLHTILYRPANNVFAEGYICLLREIESVYRQLVTLAVGTKVYSLTSHAVKQLQVPLPPYSEQQAIAAALSDMDAEITAVEEELAKYRALKRGMMQELLSGRIRLPYKKTTHRKQNAGE